VPRSAGVATLTIALSDGKAVVQTTTFTVTVRASTPGRVDEMLITILVDGVEIDEDGSTRAVPVMLLERGTTRSVTVTLLGVGSNDTLTVVLRSSTAAVVTTTPAMVVARGDGTTRTATFILQPQQAGTATLTIFVNDGDRTVQQGTFTVTVVSQQPAIRIRARVFLEGPLQ